VRFISEGYSVVGRGLSAVQPESNEVAPKYSVFGRFPHGRFLSTFEKVTPENVWEHVAAATTQSMYEKVRDSIVKGELARRSYDPPASAQEIKELCPPEEEAIWVLLRISLPFCRMDWRTGQSIGGGTQHLLLHWASEKNFGP